MEALDLNALNGRLKREKAQSGGITVSLIWNDPSDLDLHAFVELKSGDGEHIYHWNKKAAGGFLDVDMNAEKSGKRFSLEPVENIFWQSPPAGKYKIVVRSADITSDDEKWGGKFTDNNRNIPFRVFLNKNGKMETFSGTIKGDQEVKCFKFSVAGDGGTGEEYAKHKKARSTKFESETHTAGTKGMSAAAKAAAKAAAQAAAKAAAKAGGNAKARAAPPAPKAGAKRAASPAPKAKARAGSRGGGLSGKSIVFTGTLTTPRAAATAAATAAGARILGAVSANMDILIAGPGAGSKLAKAEALGKEVWDEAKFRSAAGL